MSARSLLQWMDGWFWGPRDALRLQLFQRAFAATFLLYTAAWMLNGREWLTAVGYHYPVGLQRIHQPDPWPLLPEGALWPFAALMFGAALCVMVNWRARPALWVLLGCALYIQRADLVAAFTLNKFYIVGFALLAVAPQPQTLPGHPHPVQSGWVVRVLQITLLLFYFGAGLCKVTEGDWLRSADTLWTHAQGGYRTWAAVYALAWLPKPVWTAMQWAALCFELGGCWLFLVPRLRWLAILWGTGFHLLIALFMAKLIYFSLQMLSFYLLFISPDLLRQAHARLQAAGRRPST